MKIAKTIITLSSRKSAETYITDNSLEGAWIKQEDSCTFNVRVYSQIESLETPCGNILY